MKDLSQITQSIIQKSMEAREKSEPSQSLPVVRLGSLPQEMIMTAKSLVQQVRHLTTSKGIYADRYCEKTDRTELAEIGRQQAEIIMENLPAGAFELASVNAGASAIVQMLTLLSAIKKSTKSNDSLTIVMREIAIDYDGMPAFALVMAFENLKRYESPWYPEYHEIVAEFNDATDRVEAIRNAKPKAVVLQIQEESERQRLARKARDYDVAAHWGSYEDQLQAEEAKKENIRRAEALAQLKATL